MYDCFAPETTKGLNTPICLFYSSAALTHCASDASRSIVDED
jgi:hypothetical protein